MMRRHWSQVDRNPISVDAQGHVTAALRERDKGPIHDLLAFWDTAVTGKSVLDIGVVEHTLGFTEQLNWKHGLLKQRASRIVGIDVLEPEVTELVRRGFDVRACDATSDADLGERFDVVYIGDVIEHVNDPVAMLRFAARHVADGGVVIVTTPCPFWWRNINLMIKDGTYIGNVDHVRWVIPVNALELSHRAGLTLDGYYTLETRGSSAIRRMLLGLINRVLGRNEFFAWGYVYCFSSGGKTGAAHS